MQRLLIGSFGNSVGITQGITQGITPLIPKDPHDLAASHPNEFLYFGGAQRMTPAAQH
jgi:hypothetical protein